VVHDDPQRFRIELVETMPPLALLAHQSRPAEHPQMPGDGWARHGKRLRNPPGWLAARGFYHTYGNMENHMKTTLDLPDELLIAAKKRAAETRTTLREIFERGLRRELYAPPRPPSGRRRRAIRWVTAQGGLPPGLDISDRVKMYDWLREHR